MILRNAPWYSVESWPHGLWVVPCSSRAVARDCAEDARNEGTVAYVVRAGDSLHVAVRKPKRAAKAKP